MKKLLGCLLGASLVALLVAFNLKVCRAAAAQDIPATEKFNSNDDGSTALTIYNQNFFVARHWT